MHEESVSTNYLISFQKLRTKETKHPFTDFKLSSENGCQYKGNE